MATPAIGQVDTIVQLVSGDDATAGTKAIGAYGYDPINDAMYVVAFGAPSMDSSNDSIRRINNVSGTQTVTSLITESQMRLFLVNGDPDRSIATFGQSSLVLNPKAIGSAPAYSLALLTDLGNVRFPASTSTDPAATKRVYRYDLQAASPPSGGTPTNFVADVTLSELNSAAGAVATNTTSNTGRQFAWSGDGQSIYFVDTSTPVGGLWKYQLESGNLSRISTFTDRNTEPAVVTNAGVDSIYVEGGVNAFDPVSGTTVNNTGGIDFVTHNGTTTGQPTVRVSAAALKSFFDTTSQVDIPPMTADADGNIFFGVTLAGRRGVYRLDTQNRISKVVGATERATIGSVHAQSLRMQLRTVQFDGDGAGGPNAPFPIAQVMFADSTSDGILGANAFRPGDFNRDNSITSADMDLFKAKLTVRGVVNATAADLKFDMNGNDVVDWKDVKVLQQFANFPTGDTDMHGVLDYTDLDTVGTNYGLTGKKWTEGDFASVDPLYAATAVDANTVNQVDLQALANTWLNVLNQPIAKHAVTSRGYTGQFLTDLLSAFGYTAGGPGDFNGNGTVDGADYVTLRKGLGVRYDDQDYADWRANFGTSFGSGSLVDGAAVPEPGTVSLVLVSCVGCILRLGRDRSRRAR